MSILRLEKVTREIGTFVILDAIEAAITVGDRIGLVGPNGAGKTTLLRIAAGIDEPDLGSVSRKRGLTLGLLAQESHFDTAFMASPDLRTAVRSAAGDLIDLGARLRELEHAHRVEEPLYAELQHRFEILGGYTLDQRIDETLSGLGFTRDEWTKPPSALSGGEQTRAALARLVIADPDLMLLDEPTNHLDLGALEWLEEHLRRRSGALLVASHDRAFLDGTVERVWELRDRKLTIFRGDYAAYHRQRIERDARLDKDVSTQAEQIAREQELVQRYRSHRKYAKMHEHEARLARLQEAKIETPKATRKLRLPTAALVGGGGPSRSGEIVVRAENLVVGYLPRFRQPDADPAAGPASPHPASAAEPLAIARVPFLAAQRGDRIGIVGPNGAGKTTLLRTIAGDLPPLDGVLTIGMGVSIGYLAQLRGAAIPGETVLGALTSAISITEGEARSYLARFLFRGDDTLKEVRALSGGERSRLELALLGIMPSNLLLLDEPTNHLDIPAREAIEAFMAASPATLLVVSHDRRLLETVCDRLWVVDDHLAAPFDGGYRAWRMAVAAGWTVASAVEADALRLRGSGPGGAATKKVGVAAGAAPITGSVTKHPAGNGARPLPEPMANVAANVAAKSAAKPAARPKQPKLSKDAYRKQRAFVDAELTRLGLRKNHLELALGDPAVGANFVELRRITSELADVTAALEGAEEAWLELEDRAP
ncbi:MAG TPA: ABC-F family ATP-binding cassette domain-containing protein [Candidatus Limnocylindrales bacterium]|nr:ABC-F family ATP-binding cassette domain-containing protein [Candidatus Limnocylindrales bacterium]